MRAAEQRLIAPGVLVNRNLWLLVKVPLGTGNVKRGTRNVERGTRNVERGTWNVERGTINDER